jgi:hypothetical protein
MPEWLPPTLITIVSSLLVALIAIIYRALDKRIENLEKRPQNGYDSLTLRVKYIEDELGNREKGIRGALHMHSGFHAENDGRFLRIEDKLGLSEWVRKRRRNMDE